MLPKCALRRDHSPRRLYLLLVNHLSYRHGVSIITSQQPRCVATARRWMSAVAKTNVNAMLPLNALASDTFATLSGPLRSDQNLTKRVLRRGCQWSAS